ncbi:hypothetical protein ACP70R_036181 [Stipagrostis hirtigluma subsp. patula]
MVVQAMEHKPMQLLQAVLAAEAIQEDEKVHLVVSLEDGHKLQQVLHLVPQKKVILVHIHRPAMMIPIPTMGGTVHASILKDNIVKDYREEQRGQAVQALKGFVEICTRAGVQAKILMTENDNVAAGLLELIADHKITTLVIVGIGKSWCRLISVRHQDGSVFAFGTTETPFLSSRRLSISFSSSYTSSNPSPFIWDSCSTPSSFFWDSRSTPDSLDPLQLDDPSLENASPIFDDSRLYVILGPESITTFRDLAARLNLDEYSQELHKTFQSKNAEISSRCQLIGGIDLILGADSEDFGEEYWKNIKGWPAAFDYTVRFLNTVQQLLKKNSYESIGLTPEKLSRVAKEPIIRLLDIASGVSEAKKSPDKLFCVLYMCKALVDSAPSLRKLCSADFATSVDRVLTVLHDSARGILREFKMLIQNYSSQKVGQDGSILLITGYVMKYIRLLINHAGSLDTILGHGEDNDLLSVEGVSSTGHLVCRLIGDLHNVIEEKSGLYASEGLRCIFMLNNAHFIIQEVEHSDAKLIVGAEWIKQRRQDIERYMRDYMSSSWERVTSRLAVLASPPHRRLRPILGFLQTTPRPLQSFASSFNEICNSQMHWKVPSPVLRHALRVNILEHVIGAYRAYMETLKQSLTGTAGDLESDLKIKVGDLFEG